MSPNGRRRWRVWKRNYDRTAIDPDVRPAKWWRRHTDTELAEPLPRPAFTARSLVGMTMSARKRAALRSKAPASRAVRWKMYRIGERLRPCPGCNQCGPTIEVDHLVCKACGSDNIGYNTNPDNLPSIGTCAMGSEMTGEPGAEQCNQCDGFDIETEGTMLTKLYTFSLCSGDGLLAARKARKVRG